MRSGLVCLLRQVNRMLGRVRPRAGDHGRAVADGLERGAQEPEPLVVREGRGLAGRAVHDDPVGAVVDEELAELAVAVVVDRSVGVERRHRCCQHLAQHEASLRRPSPFASPPVPQTAPKGSPVTPGDHVSGTGVTGVCGKCAEIAPNSWPVALPESVEERVQTDRQTGRQRRQLLEREQDAGDVRLPRERVVANRQELPLTPEQDLLVSDEPRQPHRMDRRRARQRLRRRLRRSRGRVLLRLAVQLDDLRAWQVPGRLGREASASPRSTNSCPAASRAGARTDPTFPPRPKRETLTPPWRAPG